jgi:hypothetical protein
VGTDQEQRLADRGTADIETIASMVEQTESVDLQALVIRDADSWQLSHATVTIGGDTIPSERTWRYSPVVFFQRRVSGLLAAALMLGKPQQIAGLKVQVPSTHSGGVLQRIEGQREWGRLITPMPRTEWELRATGTDSSQSWHSAVMVGEGPTFASFEAAYSSFFLQAPPSNNAPQRALWRVVRFDGRGWFHRITIDSNSLTVVVKGTDLPGAFVELNTPTTHLARPVGTSRKVKFRLPAGLTNHTLLVLRRDNDWLDLRHFVANSPMSANDPSMVWVQPGADVEIMIANGEGPHVEFKQEIPTKDVPRRNVLKTVAAFASGEGGTILFGVSDEAQAIGINPANLDRYQVALTSMIRDSIGPEPPTSLRPAERDGTTLLLLEVAAGDRWFALYPNTTPEFYVRRGASTVRARHEEIAAGFARQPNPHPQPWRDGL